MEVESELKPAATEVAGEVTKKTKKRSRSLMPELGMAAMWLLSPSTLVMLPGLLWPLAVQGARAARAAGAAAAQQVPRWCGGFLKAARMLVLLWSAGFRDACNWAPVYQYMRE
ncbi:MAG: hypothetical protein Q8P67_06175, partial [archaeon]|nr:hypothetical protein [archaeon]